VTVFRQRELVLRLASLLWRLRRIIAIETDLFQIQAAWPLQGSGDGWRRIYETNPKSRKV
jgi:hypothetical protein